MHMNRDTRLIHDINGRIPIIAHESLGADCCGCLVVRGRGQQAEILCNECGEVVRTVPSQDVERTSYELAPTTAICSSRCNHCGALNRFPGMSSVDVYVCSECGGGIVIVTPVQ